MTIVFDQVTGHVSPDSTAADSTQNEQTAQPNLFALERQIQHLQTKYYRRMSRLKAD